MSKFDPQDTSSLSSLLDTFYEQRMKTLERLYPERPDCIPFLRTLAIAQAPSTATWDENQHLAHCSHCQRLAAKAGESVPLTAAPPERKSLIEHLGAIFVLRPALAAASSDDVRVGDLKGLHPYTVTDALTRRRRAEIEIQSLGRALRVRQRSGAAVCLKATGKALPVGDWVKIAVDPAHTVKAVLEGTLGYPPSGEEPL